MLDLHGPGSLAIVGSPRLTLEGALLLRQLAEMLGAPLCYFNDEEERSRSMAAAALLVNKKRASMADVRGSDCIAIFGTDLREEGPMMLLAVRQAWRKGAPVFLVGAHAPLEQGAAIAIEPIQLSYLEEVPFGIFDNPVIICGTKLTTTAEIEQLHLADAEIACLFHAPNSFGAALLSVEHDGISLSKASATGKVKGVIAIEADIPAELLEGVVLLAALDWKDSAATKAAQVLLPTTAWVEMDGTFVNNEGRAQRFQRVMQPGIPIKANDPAQHPPRIHRKLPPGGNLRPAWQIIAELIERVGGERIANPLDGRWSGLVALDPNGEGVKITEIIQK
jgi:NADH-quinone oxidoreductase subunit G